MGLYHIRLKQEEQELERLLSPQERQEVEEELDKERIQIKKKAGISSLILVALGLGLGAIVLPLLDKESPNPDRLATLVLILPVAVFFQYLGDLSQKTTQRRIELMKARRAKPYSPLFSQEKKER